MILVFAGNNLRYVRLSIVIDMRFISLIFLEMCGPSLSLAVSALYGVDDESFIQSVCKRWLTVDAWRGLLWCVHLCRIV